MMTTNASNSVTRLLNLIALVVVIIFIVYADARLSGGSLFGGGGFIIWSCVPVLLAFVVLECALKRATRLGIAAAYVFSIGAVGLTIWGYASFILWPPRGPGSSTASIVFAFLPIYSVVAGIILGVIVWGILRFALRRKPSNPYQARAVNRQKES